MITREKAQEAIQYVTSQLSGYYGDIIDDYVNQLEQHIKSLEAQLANPEQIKCDSCSYCYYEMIGDYKSKGCHRFPDMSTDGVCDTFYCNFYKPKDTK